VRFDTGSSSEAVFASHTVVIANGRAGRSSRRAAVNTTGVSRTAVVSRDRKTVDAVASTTNPSQRTGTRPRPTRSAIRAPASNTPAASASSATIVIAARNTSTLAMWPTTRGA